MWLICHAEKKNGYTFLLLRLGTLTCGSLSSITNHLRPCTDVEMLVGGLGYAWTKMMLKAEADVINL